MVIGTAREKIPETRAALVPETVKRLVALGAGVAIERGTGERARFGDAEYAAAGARIANDRAEVLTSADLVVSVNKPGLDDVVHMKKGALLISFLDPFKDRGLIEALAAREISAAALELVPRTTRAQKLDALSSQASLAGYAAVVLAAERLGRVFPMMTTPSGTIMSARVLVLGAGVAGLQAIAAAKRLGARVEAFDTRPVVEEQVRSLGARFISLDITAKGETKEGYARELEQDQAAKERALIASHCARADAVIATARVFGTKAPLLVTAGALAGMRPGSVVVDLAADAGGNVEGVLINQETERNGVLVIGYDNLPGRLPADASLMYSNNVCNFIEEFWDKDKKILDLGREDEILSSCLVTGGGRILNPRVLERYAQGAKAEA